MELVKAKIKSTGEILPMGKVMKGDEVMYLASGERLFDADEVEVLEPYGMSCEAGQHEEQPTDCLQLPMEIISKVTEMVNDYVEIFDRQYWQRQRVEFVKLFIQRKDLDKNVSVKDLVYMADSFVKCIKDSEL